MALLRWRLKAHTSNGPSTIEVFRYDSGLIPEIGKMGGIPGPVRICLGVPDGEKQYCGPHFPESGLTVL